MERQAQHLPGGRLGLRTGSAGHQSVRKRGLLCERGRIVHEGVDAGGFEMRTERVPGRRPDHEEMRRALHSGPRGHEAQRQPGQQLPVAKRQGGAPPVSFRQRGEPLPKHRGLDFVEAAVPSRREVVVALPLRAGAEAPHARRQPFVRRGHQPGVAEGPEVLGGIEAERGGPPEGAERPPRSARPVRLAGVLDDRDPVAVRDLQQRPPSGARAPEDMHRNDRPDLPFLERPGHGAGVETQALGLDVGEDRG